jgi:hypothetical protein
MAYSKVWLISDSQCLGLRPFNDSKKENRLMILATRRKNAI